MLLDEDGVKIRGGRHPFPVIRIAIGAALGCILMFVTLMHNEQTDIEPHRIAQHIDTMLPVTAAVADVL